MTRKCAVLRAIGDTHTSDPFGSRPRVSGFPAMDGDVAETRVDIADLSPRDIRDMGRDPEVKAIAPAMPLKLIAPLAVDAEAEAAGNADKAKDVWGLDAVKATSSGFTGAGVTVAVLDTGIDASHPAFQGVELVQKDFSGSGNGDKNGHGTHCAGTIFGRDVEGTRIGVARGVQKALIGKVLADNGGGSSEMLFSAIQWALEKGAKVLSMSLGFDFPGMVANLTAQSWPADLATSAALEAYRGNLRMFDALMDMLRARAAFDGGALVVAAAGNESKRQIKATYEIAVSLPAAAAGVISVGALGRSEKGFTVADFSNTLPEISAPGVAILSAKTGGGLHKLSGTSMATPHVAGLAALWWDYLGTTPVPVSARNVTAKLLATARTDVFAPGVEIPDRGVGLATAPV